MIYLMIDSTSLIQIASNTDNSNDYLGQLEHAIDSGKVSFVSHETLKEEWEKHRNDWITRSERKESHLRKQGQDYNSEAKDKLQRYLRNVRIIEVLMARAISLPYHEGLEKEIGSRIVKKQAPFRDSHKASKDWNILGSFCLYCIDYNIKQLYFVSHNHTDFTDLKNLDEVDPSIASRFPKVKINYYRHYSKFLAFVDNVKVQPRLNDYPLSNVTKFTFKNSNLSSKKNNKILDSLFNVFDKIYNELAFVPPYMLLRLYPFSSSESSNAYYTNLSGVHINEDLVSFFKSISIKGKSVTFKDSHYLKNCDTPNEKILAILDRIKANRILNLRSAGGNFVKIDFPETDLNPGNEIHFYTFSYSKISRTEIAESSNLISQVRQAYILFQVGEFYKSYVILNDVKEIANREGKYLLYLVCLYNLKNLSTYATGPLYPNGQFSQQIIDRLESLSFQAEANRLRAKTNEYIVLRLQNDTFYYYALEKIGEYANKIDDHYRISLNGGWSQNSNIENLMGEFYELEGFLSANGIMYDHYSNFSKLFQNVLRGLFGAYSISSKGGRNFNQINDYWVCQIISYGTRDSIIRYINNYNIKTIKYQTLHPEFEFVKIATNFFDSYEDEEFVKNLEGNYVLSNRLRTNLENFVTLGAFLELDNRRDAKFVNRVISHYVSQPTYVHFYIHFTTLLRKKAQHADKTHIEKLINFCCTDVSEEKIRVLCSCFSSIESNSKNLNKSSVDTILELYESDKYIDAHYATLLLDLLRLLPVRRKGSLLKLINKRSYQPNEIFLTCIALTENAVPFDELRFLEILSLVDLSERQYFGRILHDDFTNFEIESVNQIINMCFKYHVDTSARQFDLFKSLCPYYKWILNMEDFDYNLFSAEWILHLDTRFAYQKMAECSKLLRYLDKDRETQKDEQINSAVVEIFSRLIK